MKHTTEANSAMYSFYVKYDRLRELINAHYAGSNAVNLDIYVDMYSILRNVFTMNSLSYTNDKFITTGIINLCAHYREFFKTRYQVSTRFYIINSSSFSPNLLNQFLSSYNKSYKSTNTTINLIGINNKILNEVSLYLPGIYYINTEFEFGVIYKHLCSKTTPNLIITKDVYNYQLINDNTKILRPRKDKGNDISYIVDNNNVYYHLMVSRKCNIEHNDLSIDFISLIFALSRCPERNIKSLYNTDYIIKTLSLLVSNGFIPNSKIYNTNNFTKIFNDSISNRRKLDPELLNLRYIVTDIEYQYDNIFKNNTNISIINTRLVDLYDPIGVQKLNESLFKDLPLDLLSL